jgi:starch synthase (maltosyl-transferring)
VDNDCLLCYSKSTPDRHQVILVVVNLDPRQRQVGMVELPLHDFHLDEARPYQVHDLLHDTLYLWNGPRNFVELVPEVTPAHIFAISCPTRFERDFAYYL